MKILKKFFIIILSIILIVLCREKAEAFPGDGELDISPAWYGSSGAIYYNITENTPTHYDNVYCIEKGDALMTKSGSHPYCYCRRAKATMDGDTITLKRYDKYGDTTKTETRTRVEADYIIASILCYGSDRGLWAGTDASYTSSQKALFEYWNTWRNTANNSKYFPSGGGSGSGVSNFAAKAETRAYNLTIELFESESSGYQNIIIVSRNGYDNREQPKVDITVEKVWDDESNAYGNRPSSLTLDVYNSSGSKVTSTTLSGSGNTWSKTISDLESDSYYVRESDIIGYSSPSYSGTQVTNSLARTSVKVTKKWSDDNNKNGKRPNSVSVTLYANGTEFKTATLNSSSDWSYKFSNLPQYMNKEKVTYTIKENTVDDYISEITGDENSGFVITNTLQTKPLKEVIITNKHDSEKININVTKKWEDENNLDKKRPSSITVRLMANGSVAKDANGNTMTATLSGTGNEWTHIFKNLYKYEAGKEIEYTVEEDTVNLYTKKITGNKTSGFIITNTFIPKIQVTVTKKWDDDNNRDGLRKTVQVTLYVNEQIAKDINGNTMTANLEAGKNWTHTFTDLLKYDSDGNLITYTVKEKVPDGYGDKPLKIEGNQTDGYIITNKHIPEVTSVKVTKAWDDMDNLDDLRKPVTVTLMANGAVAKDVNGNIMTATLEKEKNWTHTFENIFKYYNQGTLISYTVEEEVPEEYGDNPFKIEGNQTDGYIITNKHEPKYVGYTEIIGRVWMDGAPGKGSQPNGVYDSQTDLRNGKIMLEDGQEVKVRLKDKDGNPIKSTYYYIGKDENGNPEQKTSTEYALITNISDGIYNIRVNYDNSKNVYKLYEDEASVKTKLQNAYVEFEYDGLKYTTVKNYTSGTNKSKAIENQNDEVKANNTDSHTRNGNDNSLDNKYSTITSETTPLNELDIKYKNIIAETNKMKNYSSSTTTRPEIVKCCNGNGTYNHTNHLKAWDTIEQRNCADKNDGHKTLRIGVEVQLISNINLGLFEREQPDVAIFSELKEVKVDMRNQQYTYKYGNRTTVTEADAERASEQAYQKAINEYGMTENDARNYSKQEKINAKFQNVDTYTYRRPVNPADISYIDKVDDEAMHVYVTYEINISNTSWSLPITVDEIVNVYDSKYEIRSIKKNGDNVTRDNRAEVYDQQETDPFKQVKLYGLNIKVEPLNQTQSNQAIVITYEIMQDKLVDLFNNNAPLNNAVEILSYTTRYGAQTLYAGYAPNSGQGIGGRTGMPYGGYDKDSHPGNAEIEYNQTTKRLESKNLVEYKQLDGTTKTGPEDDTDFAPAFVLEKDPNRLKILSGTVWEDTKSNETEQEADERLGNGYQDSSEKTVQNVEVELYELNGNRAIRFDENGNNITYNKITTKTDEDENLNGKYDIPGVVTGEYYVKYIYGNYDKDSEKTNDKEEPQRLENTTKIADEIEVNARNYKSTIITEAKIKDMMEDKSYDDKWHITHEDRYSVAVDNMYDRLMIDDLTYGTYDMGVNMTAYTMPFKSQVEFDADGESQSTAEGIIDVPNVLSKLDFGIIERPKENLLVQKTISYFKITLANGQVLTEGNPINGNINYAKTLGFRQNIKTAEEAKNALEKKLMVEMDAELIQGAKMDVKYDVTVINNNEIDYDYGTTGTYQDEKEAGIFISRKLEAKYYYFGDDAGLNKMKATIEFIDYLDDDLVYNEEEGWVVEKELQNLVTNGIISQKALDAIGDNRYKVLRKQEGTRRITLERDPEDKKNEHTESMTASRLLSNQEQNIFDNNAEIIFIDSKTARTVKDIIETADGPEILDYTPGNYEPSLDPREEILESDDDRVEIRITPPTGITNNIIQYVLIALAGLIIAFIGITFIKKKVVKR